MIQWKILYLNLCSGWSGDEILVITSKKTELSKGKASDKERE
jgi:hypothetical protein